MAKMSHDILQFFEPSADGAPETLLSARERPILDALNQKIAGQESLRAIVDHLFQATRAVSPCDRVSVALLDEDERLVAHTVAADYQPLLLDAGYSEDPRRGSLHDVLEHGRVRVIHDLERYREERPRSASTRLLVREGVRSNLTVPLLVDSRAVGFLFRSARRPRAYARAHAALQQAVAERLAQTVEKLRQIERLRAANEAYFEMLGFVTHELRSPVASMMASAQLLTDGYLGDLAPAQTDAVRRIINTGEYLSVLIREYLDLAKLEGREMTATMSNDVDFLNTVVAPVLDILRPQWEQKDMRLLVEIPADLAPLRLDPDLFKIVLVNLLGNAVKYGENSGEIRLRATCREGRLELSVWNQGPGFAASERPRLFRKFSRLKDPELLKQKGTGIGLYTVWRIVQLHAGRVDARSEPGRWAEFTVEIPQPPPR